MRVSVDACCVGGPIREQSPVSAGALLVLAAIYGIGAVIVIVAAALVL